MVNLLDMFQLVLVDAKTTFVPGSMINGYITLPAELDIHRLTVVFAGVVSTHLFRNDYMCRNILFANKKTLYASDSDSLEESGPDRVFAFTFRVPPTALPASFSGSQGKVEYSLKATLMSANFAPLSEIVIVTIPPTKDIAQTVPQQMQSHVDSKRGALECTISTDQAEYCFSDIMNVKVDVLNHSPCSYTIERICLKQRVSYVILGRPKTKSEHVHIIPYTETISHTGHASRMVRFPIPETMDADNETKLITVTHRVQVDVRFGKKRLKLTVPIVICGFPFMLFDDHLTQVTEQLPVYHNGLSG